MKDLMQGEREEEIVLTGGRVTANVVRRGSFVHRSMCRNSAFVHEVLLFLEGKGIAFTPHFRGIDEQGREILDFVEGTVPDNLGRFSEQQCCQAVHIMKALHECLRNFPGCPQGMTVCHNDLSPCNFVFSGGRPIAVIDWDAAAFGNPLDDLAYSVWMWLDMGNEESSAAFVRKQMDVMLDAYGVSRVDRDVFGNRILAQMDRVGNSIFPTREQTNATRRWVSQCKAWLGGFLEKYEE